MSNDRLHWEKLKSYRLTMNREHALSVMMCPFKGCFKTFRNQEKYDLHISMHENHVTQRVSKGWKASWMK